MYRYEKDRIRTRLNKYTRKAFSLLTTGENPRILDVGCGTGVPTLELAKLTNGVVTGIDTDETALSVLQRKIIEQGLSHRMRVMNESLRTMTFPDESFDIIWAEGSLFVLGFEKSIQAWSRYLKPQGFLVCHDENTDVAEKLHAVAHNGYMLIDSFEVPADAWRRDYYLPLEHLIHMFRANNPDDAVLMRELDNDQREIDKSKVHATVISSLFVIMQKTI